MQSSGGLADAAGFQGKDAILSGPAGGIVGAARTASAAGLDRIISFDMGGTSTDVALYTGEFERAFDTQVAGVRMRAPMMAINTVAAGGGSILHFDGARFRVGPDSAGADPGPACYRRGGPLTVTDANVCVGKIQPKHFPAIFGPNADAPLDADVVTEKFAALADDIAKATGQPRTPRQVAEGFLQIAVANMANAIKQVSVQKGHDATRFALQCFGGAGGQHACLVADALGMETVFIHPFAGVLSAYGMGLADQTVMREQAVEIPLEPHAMAELRELADKLAEEATAALAAQGADPARISAHRTLHLRYAGTEAALIVPLRSEQEIVADFTAAHRARFGFATEDRELVVEAVAVEANAPGDAVQEATLPARPSGAPPQVDSIQIFTGDKDRTAPVFDRTDLLAGDRIAGPALIREANATAALEAGGKILPMPGDDDSIEPEWRLYARSAADDKAGVMAILTAFAALQANRIQPTANIKFFFEGEEEAGSPHLGEIIALHKELLQSDVRLAYPGNARHRKVGGASRFRTIDRELNLDERPRSLRAPRLQYSTFTPIQCSKWRAINSV
jgi:5-oxoprolinase (ATP-hydrolysing)